MKLNSIKLENFRCFDDLELAFDKPVNFIFGPNASGKSTIAEAMALSLTGRCNGFNPTWRDRAALVRQGFDTFKIDLNIDLIASLAQKGAQSGGEKIIYRPESRDCSPKPDAIAKKLGVSKEALTALFDTGHFFSLHPDEKKRVIFDLLDLKVTRSNIKGKLRSWLKEQTGLINKYRIDPEDDLLSCLGNVPESLEDGYQQAFEERRLIKRDMKSLGPIAEIEDGTTIESIKEKIGSIQAEINALHTRLGEANGMALGEKKHLEAEIGEITSILEQLLSETKGFKPGLESKRLSNLENKRSEASQYIRALNEDLKNLEEQINGLGARKAEKKAIHPRLIGFDGRCPLLDSPVECKTGEVLEAISDIRRTTEHEMSVILAEEERLKETLKETSSLIEKAEKELHEINKQISESKERIAHHEDVKRRIDELKARKQKAESTLASLDEGKIKESENLREKINRLQADLEKNRGLLIAAEKEDKRKALEARLNKLEVLTHAFSPRGIMADLLSGAVKSLNDSLSASMERISGGKYSLETCVNDDVDFYLINHEAALRTNIKLASTSERFRAGIVIQYALSNLTGLRFMLIDGLDILDQENKGFFFEFIQQVKKDFDNIFVFSTIGQYAPQNPNLPDIDFWIIEEGRVTKIKPGYIRG